MPRKIGGSSPILSNNNPSIEILYKNGDLYIGQASEKKRNGIGTYTFQSGFKITGKWAKDRIMHGTKYDQNGRPITQQIHIEYKKGGIIKIGEDSPALLLTKQIVKQQSAEENINMVQVQDKISIKESNQIIINTPNNNIHPLLMNELTNQDIPNQNSLNDERVYNYINPIEISDDDDNIYEEIDEYQKKVNNIIMNKNIYNVYSNNFNSCNINTNEIGNNNNESPNIVNINYNINYLINKDSSNQPFEGNNNFIDYNRYMNNNNNNNNFIYYNNYTDNNNNNLADSNKYSDNNNNSFDYYNNYTVNNNNNLVDSNKYTDNNNNNFDYYNNYIVDNSNNLVDSNKYTDNNNNNLFNDIIDSTAMADNVEGKNYPGGVYVGQLQNGKREGNGTFTYLDGTQISGNWINDALPSGTFIDKTKTKYIGPLLNGKPHAECGHFYSADGDQSYACGVNNGKLHGAGIHTDPKTNNKFEIIWNNGVGIYIEPETGNKFQIKMINGKMEIRNFI